MKLLKMNQRLSLSARLDLANNYLRLRKCPRRQSKQLSVLCKLSARQAIYINPNEVNLYQLLGIVSEDQMIEFSKSIIYKIGKATKIQRDP